MGLLKKKWFALGSYFVIGALLGYAYYHFIGCQSGACPISSNPYVSTIYGGIAGILIGWPSKSKKLREENDN